jgi:hypothetical protein
MKSAGQRLVDAVEKWLGAYLFLADKDLPLVLALWAIGSWTFDRFYTWPYLAVTAAVKGAGKTRVLELLQPITRNAHLSAGPTPAYVLRKASALGGHFTLLWDEAEAATSDKKGFLSEVLNSGYRRGQTIGRAKGPDDVVEYPSYFPKAFALIGDPTGTVRDRSIILTMERGNAEREYVPEVVAGEAAALAEAIKHTLTQGSPDVASDPPQWLDARDREIWGAMFGLAKWLQLDKPTVERLQRWAADNVASKTAPRRRNISNESEDEIVNSLYSERAVRDMLTVYRDGEDRLPTVVVVERLRDIPTSPWRQFRGVGLNAIALSDLVSRHGVQPKSIQFGKGRTGRKVLQGYYRADVQASIKG